MFMKLGFLRFQSLLHFRESKLGVTPSFLMKSSFSQNQIFNKKHCNFKDKIINYKDMRPVSNQPAVNKQKLCQKVNLLDEITVENLKLRPIISQLGTHKYNAAKVVANYLKTIFQNEYKIGDTQ